MKKRLSLKKKTVLVGMVTFLLLISCMMYSAMSKLDEFDGSRGAYGGEPVWIYDSDLYVKHVEVAQLNGGGALDVIAGEYSMNYYDTPSKVYGINGDGGGTLWTYSLNDGVRSMTIGDINNDGVMDAVAGASKGSSTPDGRVHAIDGTDGSMIWRFTPGGTGDTNGDVAIGDFDGDAYPDVAVACWDDYVYAINGSTGTQLWRREIDSIFINAVATGDVDGDGIDDVAFCHEYLAGWDNYFGVLNGINGTPIWQQVEEYITVDVLIDDIDDDGTLETVFGMITDTDQAYIQVRTAINGSLEWQYHLGSCDHVNGAIYLYAYDVDEDTDTDLVVGNYLCTYNIYVFNGDSSTPMLITEAVDGFPRDISVGDVIGDGDLNLLAATYDRVQVLEATDGSKTWYYSVAGTIASVSNTDVDGDGIADVIAGGGAETTGTPPNPAKAVWALKTTESQVLWEYDFGQYGNALLIYDFNGDPYMDVVTVCSLDDRAWLIDGETGLDIWSWTGTENLYMVTSGDFDNDGQVDVAVAGNDDRVTALYGNNGSVMWQFNTPGDQIYRKCLQATDVNGDGNVDVIAGSDDNHVYAINGLTGIEIWSAAFAGDVEEVELAEMDGYPPLDVVAAIGWSGNKMAVINGSTGDVLWEYTQFTEYARHVEVLDLGNDAVLDVAIGVPKMGATPGRLIMVDGDTQSEVWTVTPFLPTSEFCLGHGDLDGDGVDDLLAGGNYDDKTVYAFNGVNGAPLWTYPTGGEVNVVQVYDVNGDSTLEVVAGSDDQNVYVLNGTTGDELWSYSTAGDVMHLQIGDISGEDTPNIACVTFDSDGVVYAFYSLAPAMAVDPDQSFVTLTAENHSGLTTCPALDVSVLGNEIYEYVQVTVKNTLGQPMAGIPAGEFAFDVYPGNGSHYYDTLSCTFVAVDNATNGNGEIRFTVQGDTSIQGYIVIRATVMGVELTDADDLLCNSYDQWISMMVPQDGIVGLQDFGKFASDYGSTNWESDFNWGGTVDLVDFGLFASHWGHHT